MFSQFYSLKFLGKFGFLINLNTALKKYFMTTFKVSVVLTDTTN